MWVFTKEGVFSAVWDRYCRGDEVMIRAHSKDDLCRLAKKIIGYCDENLIFEAEDADYRFRIKIPKTVWSEYLADCALQIDYPSVKENIIPDNDPLRKDAYYQVWETLFRWRSKKDLQDRGDDDSAKEPRLFDPLRWHR
jgi:hypothetical protein